MYGSTLVLIGLRIKIKGLQCPFYNPRGTILQEWTFGETLKVLQFNRQKVLLEELKKKNEEGKKRRRKAPKETETK